ncbi:MAG: M18 family aminopeptidase [Candidatus Ornithospirochaeta sp.]|nr:M18 family aminopeptidase [Candidatus Ornithospirochaeta sp.]
MTENNMLKDLLSFISSSPSQFHAVDSMKRMLSAAGFAELDERKRYSLKRGGAYYVSRNSSSLIAFRIPEGGFSSYSVISAHTDSPTFRLKPNPEVSASGYTVLNAEGYGGMLISSWFDRPLSIAGRAFVLEDGSIKEHLVSFDRDLVMIPSLAIHQNREANKGINYSIQKEVRPLIAEGECSIDGLIAECLGVERKSILSSDLFLVNRTAPSVWGACGEFFSSPRIDDLECAYTAVRAIIESSSSDKLQIAALFDNEEVGSGTKQGALSDFLYQTIQRIMISLSVDEEERMMIQSSSFMLSADNGHAVHPNYPEKSDIVNHPRLNGGVLLKLSANQKYTTDGESYGFARFILERNSIPYQDFVNNSDVPGGSTLGNLSTQKVSIRTADVGLAQLAMHSSYESAGSRDIEHLYRFFRAFLEY